MPNSPKTWAEARAAALRQAKAMTPSEDARINQGIAADRDTRELTDEDFARMKPARGRPAKPPEERKKSVTLRLSPDVIEAFQASGPGWHTRINDALRREAPRISRLVAAKPAGVTAHTKRSGASKSAMSAVAKKSSRTTAAKKNAVHSVKKAAAKTAARTSSRSSSRAPARSGRGRTSSTKR